MNSRRKKSIPLSRRQGNSELKRTIFIVCEGKKTEPEYLHNLKVQWMQQYKGVSNRVKLEIQNCDKSGGNTPSKLIDYAIKLQKKEKDSEVWCVFDVEAKGSIPNLINLVQHAKKKSIKLAMSNPAFEFWLLLHFQLTTTSYTNCSEVTRDLKKHWAKYKKCLRDFGPIDGKFDKASENSKYVRSYMSKPTGGDPIPRPSTDMDILIDHLIELITPVYLK